MPCSERADSFVHQRRTGSFGAARPVDPLLQSRGVRNFAPGIPTSVAEPTITGCGLAGFLEASGRSGWLGAKPLALRSLVAGLLDARLELPNAYLLSPEIWPLSKPQCQCLP